MNFDIKDYRVLRLCGLCRYIPTNLWRYYDSKLFSATSMFTLEEQSIHKNLQGIDKQVLYYLMRNPVKEQSIEYNDNRLSLYCGQYGKCAISGEILQINDIHCHHIKHKSQGGTDKYENLMLVTKDVHILLHATSKETITKTLAKLNLSSKQKAKLNYYREKAGLVSI